MRPSDALDAHRLDLRDMADRYGVSQPRVFGSVLSGADTDSSDLDILVEPSDATTLLTLAAFQNEAEALLGVAVSVLTPMSLPVQFRARVLDEARPV